MIRLRAVSLFRSGIVEIKKNKKKNTQASAEIAWQRGARVVITSLRAHHARVTFPLGGRFSCSLGYPRTEKETARRLLGDATWF